jgi:hypothetical protein
MSATIQKLADKMMALKIEGTRTWARAFIADTNVPWYERARVAWLYLGIELPRQDTETH